MSSYHSSFTYLGKNTDRDKDQIITSGDNKLIIAAFDADNGDCDTFLSMEPIIEDSYDGAKSFDYGAKFNSKAVIKITLIKSDGSDFSVSENRSILRWLTGSRVNSWLDFYAGTQYQYSFFGRVTDVKQRKLDSRVIGIVVTFTSVHPWAYSSPNTLDRSIGVQALVFNQDDGAIEAPSKSGLAVDNDGVLYNVLYDGDTVKESSFAIDYDMQDVIVYNDEKIVADITNETDDLYTYINLDITYKNISGSSIGNTLTIKNYRDDEYETTEPEITEIKGITAGEEILLSAGQFIISNTYQGKIFGDSFNFIWPRLSPGLNHIVIEGTGQGTVQFTYRHPIKIGDCAVDINNILNNSIWCYK